MKCIHFGSHVDETPINASQAHVHGSACHVRGAHIRIRDELCHLPPKIFSRKMHVLNVHGCRNVLELTFLLFVRSQTLDDLEQKSALG